LVVAAAFADRSGSAAVAFYAFLALVAVASVIALSSYGQLLEASGEPRRPQRQAQEETARRLQALLWAVLVGLAVIGAASRAPSLGEGKVPGIAGTVVIGCLLVLCIEGLVALDAQRRRVPVRRVVAPERARSRRREAA
jgi:hypothetical protein